MNKLNIGQAFSGVGQKPPQKELKEILNIRAILEGQSGILRPTALYSFHVNPESASMQWFAPYEQGCFRSCLQNKAGEYICSDLSGVYKENPDGTRTYLADRDRALMQQFIPGLGTVVPNKLISTPLSCGADPILQLQGNGQLTIVSSNCPATECAAQSLVSISGTAFGNDLTKVMGKVQTVYTSLGVASASGSEFQFIRTKGVQSTNLIGRTNVNATATDADKKGVLGTPLGSKESLVGKETRFSSIELLGDARMRVKGGTHEDDALGQLQTIQTENGVIHFDPVTRKLHIALRTLADIRSSDLTSVSAKPASIEVGKVDATKLVNDLSALASKLAANQKLTADEIDLLRKALERPAPSTAGLTPTERDLLNKAVAKQNAGQALSREETELLKRVLDQQRYPGVIVLPGEKIDAVQRALSDQKVDDAKASSIVDALRTGTPLTPEQKNTASNAVDASSSQGKMTAAQAADIKQSLQQATATSARTQEIVEAASEGDRLTDAQKQEARDAISREQQRAFTESATGVSGTLPGIALTGAVDKVGGASAREFNTALEKIGPLQHFATPEQDVHITHNAKGDAVVRVQDKKTGDVRELAITGPARQDGSSVVIPTKEGPMKFDVNVNRDSGAPQITINGPGMQSTAPLILAQGPNGLLYYDPQTGTWKALNGLGIPADEAFGKYGAQFRGGAGGTSGVPAPDPFGYQTVLQPVTSSNPLLSLPSWPEYAPAFALMLSLVLAGMMAIRHRSLSSKSLHSNRIRNK